MTQNNISTIELSSDNALLRSPDVHAEAGNTKHEESEVDYRRDMFSVKSDRQSPWESYEHEEVEREQF